MRGGSTRMPAAGEDAIATGPVPATPARLTVPRTATEIDRRFEAIIFDWDGTAVPDRLSDASTVRELVEALCARRG